MSIGMHFCPECNNLLNPIEDRQANQILFKCRSCPWDNHADPDDVEFNCIDRINFNYRSKEDVTSYIVPSLQDDPTLPRENDFLCPKCYKKGAVYFQLPERVKNDAMTLVFVCIHCTHYIVRGKENQGHNEEELMLEN